MIEAKEKASAIQTKPTAEVAVAGRDRSLAEARIALLGARVVLAEGTKAVLGYGTAGPRLVGRSRADLRRLGRLPSRTVNG